MARQGQATGFSRRFGGQVRSANPDRDSFYGRRPPITGSRLAPRQHGNRVATRVCGRQIDHAVEDRIAGVAPGADREVPGTPEPVWRATTTGPASRVRRSAQRLDFSPQRAYFIEDQPGVRFSLALEVFGNL